MTSSGDSLDDVGYRHPPKHSRFRRGLSGNPTGRPKGTLNLKTIIARATQEKVVVKSQGRRKIVTKLEAVIAQLIDKAESGDLKAIQLLTSLVRSTEEREASVSIENSSLDEFDKKALSGILERFGVAGKGTFNDTDER